MSYMEWKDKVSDFKAIDVRGIQGNFFQGLKKQAMMVQTPVGMKTRKDTVYIDRTRLDLKPIKARLLYFNH